MAHYCDSVSNIDKETNNIVFNHDSDVSLLPKRDNATAVRAPAASIPVSAGVENSAWHRQAALESVVSSKVEESLGHTESKLENTSKSYVWMES